MEIAVPVPSSSINGPSTVAWYSASRRKVLKSKQSKVLPMLVNCIQFKIVSWKEQHCNAEFVLPGFSSPQKHYSRKNQELLKKPFALIYPETFVAVPVTTKLYALSKKLTNNYLLRPIAQQPTINHDTPTVTPYATINLGDTSLWQQLPIASLEHALSDTTVSIK